MGNPEYRKSITKFRISNHRLPIESGRKNSIERPNRLCTACNLFVGDEKHVLLNCTNKILTQLRFKFIARIHNTSPQFIKLSSDSQILYILGMYDETLFGLVGKYLVDILKIYPK